MIWTRFIGLAAALTLGAAVAGETVFPERTLRAYGPTRAEFRDGVLHVTAATPAAAERWQAKYLSDLTRTTGTVTPATVAGIPAYRPPQGGVVAGVRSGRDFFAVYGATDEEFAARLRAVAPDARPEHARAAVEVPMYLDDLEQYAFRFYYWNGNPIPPGQTPATYDPQTEFDYAAQAGDLGFIFWANAHDAEFAAGLTNENVWNWGYKLAKARRLPIILNTTIGSVFSVVNAWREETAARMPYFSGSFHSVAEPLHGGMGTLSWAADEGRIAELQTVQRILRKYNGPEVIETFEPHSELNHGPYTLFLEYGPLVDQSFRQFLRERYPTLDALSLAWHGEPGRLGDWSEVRLPQVADFLGGDAPGVVDLAGDWRLAYLEPLKETNFTRDTTTHLHDLVETEPVPPEYYAVDFDDTALPLVRDMPGSDEQMLLPKRPAVARRVFRLDEKPAGKTYLYLWDLNYGKDDPVEIWINGVKAGDDKLRHAIPHWMACEVGEHLREGDNLLALRLPRGHIGYRIYLTPEAPRAYPFLGPHPNARWRDFSDWQGWSRNRAVEHGLSAIREVEPDKHIINSAPAHYANQMRELCRRFGMYFHDTGIMSVIFVDLLPMLMRGADLPVTIEPGGPAHDLADFKLQTGLHTINGTQAIHYYIHVGSVVWRDDIRTYFEKILPALRQLGRQHQEKADVALLIDSDVAALGGYPWVADGNAAYPSGFWNWRFNETLYYDFPLDALVPADFANGLADPYKVILDTNNTFLRPETLAGIEQWVRNGGVFVAMTQTGRHTPLEPDSWSPQRLGGWRPEIFSRYDARGQPETPASLQTFSAAAGNALDIRFDGLGDPRGDGARLHPAAADAVTLLRWADGSTAVGARRVGKGFVVTCGLRLAYNQAFTRIILKGLLDWAGARPLAVGGSNFPVRPRHYVSNNGLHDIWVAWNADRHREQPYRFEFRDGQPRQTLDLLTGAPGDLEGTLPPFEFKMLSSPRPSASAAALTWFKVQRGHWQGAEPPPHSIADRVLNHTRNTLPLDGVWELNENPDRPDGPWRPVALEAWIKGGDVASDRVRLRRVVEIPADWKNGTVYFWSSGTYLPSVKLGSMKVWADGKEIADALDGGVAHVRLDVAAGDRVELQLEIVNRHPRVSGLVGACFLAFIPDPEREVDLNGVWRVRAGVSAPTEKRRRVPGPLDGSFLTRDFEMPPLADGERANLRVDGSSHLIGFIVNGTYIRRHHHMIGSLTYMDITHLLRPGATNTLSVVSWEENPEIRGRIRDIRLFLNRPASE